MKTHLMWCSGLSLMLVLAACGQSSQPVTPTTSSSAACKSAIGLSADSLGLNGPSAGFITGQSALATAAASTLAPANTASSPNWSAPRVPGELLLLSSDHLSAQAVQQLRGLEVSNLGDGIKRVKTPEDKTDLEFAKQLSATGLKVQPNFIYHGLGAVNDPGFPGNAGINFGGFNAFQTYLPRIRVPEAWATLSSCGLTPQGALTALIDSSVEASHPELQSRITLGAAQLPADAAADYKGHGTAGAGIIGANANNGMGLSGIVWKANILSEEVLDASGGTTAQIAQGINDAVKKGALVINLSLGEPEVTGDTVLDKAINSALQSAVVVAAAGNSANQGVYYPANLPGVIAVGSTGNSDAQLACYSARPSAELPRKLDIVAPSGAGYLACDDATQEQDMLLLAPSGSYTLEAGTSFAAPQVSAVAALMRAANPKLSAADTRKLLVGSVNSASGLPLLDANAAIKAALRGY